MFGSFTWSLVYITGYSKRTKIQESETQQTTGEMAIGTRRQCRINWTAFDHCYSQPLNSGRKMEVWKRITNSKYVPAMPSYSCKPQTLALLVTLPKIGRTLAKIAHFALNVLSTQKIFQQFSNHCQAACWYKKYIHSQKTNTVHQIKYRGSAYFFQINWKIPNAHAKRHKQAGKYPAIPLVAFVGGRLKI